MKGTARSVLQSNIKMHIYMLLVNYGNLSYLKQRQFSVEFYNACIRYHFDNS